MECFLFLVTVVPYVNLVISLGHDFRATMKASPSSYSKQSRQLSLDHFFLLTVLFSPFTFYSSTGLDTSSRRQLTIVCKGSKVLTKVSPTSKELVFWSMGF